MNTMQELSQPKIKVTSASMTKHYLQQRSYAKMDENVHHRLVSVCCARYQLLGFLGNAFDLLHFETTCRGLYCVIYNNDNADFWKMCPGASEL
jgi:hypothetical protein